MTAELRTLTIVALFTGAVAFLGWAAMDQHTKLNTACIEHNGTFTQGMCIYGAARIALEAKDD